MKRILFISVAFPPKNDPECLQTSKYFHFLQQQNCTIDVVTSAIPTLNMPYDQELEKYTTGIAQKIEIQVKENKYVNYLLRKLKLNQLDRPDSKYKFIDGFDNVIRNLSHVPDLIYSRSYPLSSTLLAAKLVEHYRVPWVLHLSDPWTLSPLHSYNKATTRWHESAEKRCFALASALCFTSGQTLKAYQEKYPVWAEKMHLFPNVIDASIQIRSEFYFENKLRVCYTGGLNGTRSPEPILAAIQKFFQKYPEGKDLLEFIFVGTLDRKNRKIAESYHLPGTSYTGQLAFSKTVEIQNQAHVLLLIDTPLEPGQTAHFLPSKLPDYLASGKRVLALTNPDSPSSDFLKEELADIVYYGDENRIATILETYLSEFKKNNRAFFVANREMPEVFSAQYQAAKLNRLFESLIRK